MSVYSRVRFPFFLERRSSACLETIHWTWGPRPRRMSTPERNSVPLSELLRILDTDTP